MHPGLWACSCGCFTPGCLHSRRWARAAVHSIPQVVPATERVPWNQENQTRTLSQNKEKTCLERIKNAIKPKSRFWGCWAFSVSCVLDGFLVAHWMHWAIFRQGTPLEVAGVAETFQEDLHLGAAAMVFRDMENDSGLKRSPPAEPLGISASGLSGLSGGTTACNSTGGNCGGLERDTKKTSQLPWTKCPHYTWMMWLMCDTFCNRQESTYFIAKLCAPNKKRW